MSGSPASRGSDCRADPLSTAYVQCVHVHKQRISAAVGGREDIISTIVHALGHCSLLNRRGPLGRS